MSVRARDYYPDSVVDLVLNKVRDEKREPIAKKAGCSRSGLQFTLSEKGKNLSLGLFIRLADAVGVDIDTMPRKQQQAELLKKEIRGLDEDEIKELLKAVGKGRKLIDAWLDDQFTFADSELTTIEKAFREIKPQKRTYLRRPRPFPPGAYIFADIDPAPEPVVLTDKQAALIDAINNHDAPGAMMLLAEIMKEKPTK